MSIWSEITSVGIKIEDFLTSIVKGAQKLRAVYKILSGPTLAATSAVFYDVVKTVAAAESAASAVSTGNVTGAITLSETTLSLVKQLVVDFKAEEAQIVADFDALGIKL
jgi:Ca2+/Na+ antiporter